MRKHTPRQRYVATYRNLKKAAHNLYKRRIEFAKADYNLELHDRNLEYVHNTEEHDNATRSELLNALWSAESNVSTAKQILSSAKYRYRTAAEYTKTIYWSRVTKKGSMRVRYGYVGKAPNSRNPWNVALVGDDYNEIYQLWFNPEHHNIQIDIPSEFHGLAKTKEIAQNIIDERSTLYAHLILKTGCPYDFPRHAEVQIEEQENEQYTYYTHEGRLNTSENTGRMILRDLKNESYNIFHKKGFLWGKTKRGEDNMFKESLTWYHSDRDKEDVDYWRTVQIQEKSPLLFYRRFTAIYTRDELPRHYRALPYADKIRILKASKENS